MSKEGKEIVQAAREAVAHARGRIVLKEFRADMTEEERELLLGEITAADSKDASEAASDEGRDDKLPTRSRRPVSRRQVAAARKSS